MHPLIREKTRILRPLEYKKLYNAVPKKDFKTMLNALLLTGMRYVEMQRFQKNPEWFDGEFIHLPEEAILKHERKQVKRDVILNPLGKNVISDFPDVERKLPSWQTWKENLRRWAVKGKLEPTNINVKTSRKTWESWLLASYPSRYWSIMVCFIWCGANSVVTHSTLRNLFYFFINKFRPFFDTFICKIKKFSISNF